MVIKISEYWKMAGAEHKKVPSVYLHISQKAFNRIRETYNIELEKLEFDNDAVIKVGEKEEHYLRFEQKTIVEKEDKKMDFMKKGDVLKLRNIEIKLLKHHGQEKILLERLVDFRG